MRAPVLLDVRVHVLRGAAERQLAQGEEVAAAEEAVHGLARPLGQIHLPLGQALEQLLGRQVDELQLVGRVEDAVGHGLAHGHPGDPVDEVVEALEVLDVEGCVDRDPGLQQLLGVLPALGVAQARRVGVSQLVQQQHGGLPGEGRVDVELLEPYPPVFDLPRA